MKKLFSLTFVPKGRVDFPAYRQAGKALECARWGQRSSAPIVKICVYAGLRHSASISKGCALRLFQPTRPSGFVHELYFFTPSQSLFEGTMIRQGCRKKSYSGSLYLTL